MFERYTERARRVIFFGRYEASNYGSKIIEVEHLLGLLREDSHAVSRFSAEPSVATIRDDLRKRLERRGRISTSIDLPLSSECKQVLKHAGEEADSLKHRFIGTEHLLLGILRQTESVAASVLRDAGIDIDKVRQQIAAGFHAEPHTAAEPPSADRQALLAVLDEVPEERLAWAKVMLERLTGSAEPRPLHTAMMGSSQLSRAEPPRLIARGRSGRTWVEDGWLIHESHQTIQGHTIHTTERMKVSDDGRTLSYTHAVEGPKEERHQYSMEFDIS